MGDEPSRPDTDGLEPTECISGADRPAESAAPTDLGVTLGPGTRVGSYRIITVLGEGGMGIVYLAEQARPRRTVALKLIRPGVAGQDLVRRFEHEAQILGRLAHPGIAQIDEAGTADTGQGPQPFFAMEPVHPCPQPWWCPTRCTRPVDGRGENPLQIERRDVVRWCLRARGTGKSGSAVSVDSEVLRRLPHDQADFPVWRSHVPTGHG
jgi:hypothetical protein